MYYLLDEPKACFQIHFQYDFPVGYVLDAMVRSRQENPGEEVRNDVIRKRNVMRQGLKIGNNERKMEEEKERKKRGPYMCIYICISMERENLYARENNIRNNT